MTRTNRRSRPTRAARPPRPERAAAARWVADRTISTTRAPARRPLTQRATVSAVAAQLPLAAPMATATPIASAAISESEYAIAEEEATTYSRGVIGSQLAASLVENRTERLSSKSSPARTTPPRQNSGSTGRPWETARVTIPVSDRGTARKKRLQDREAAQGEGVDHQQEDRLAGQA